EAQWDVLERIASERFMPSLFARHRDSSPPAVSRIIRQLLRKGLITVSVSATDGRQRRYQLTARGRKTLDALRGLRRGAVAVMWMALAPRAPAASPASRGEPIPGRGPSAPRHAKEAP